MHVAMKLNRNWRRWKKNLKRSFEHTEDGRWVLVNMHGNYGLMSKDKGVPHSVEARRYHVEWQATEC